MTSTSAIPYPASPPAAPGRLGRLLRWAMALHVAYAVLYVGIYHPLTVYGVDWDKHYQAARAILEGRNPYILEHLWIGFNYPQASAILFAWIGFFDLGTAQSIWKLAMFALAVGCALLAWRCYRPSDPESGNTGAAGASPARRAALAHWGLVAAFAVSLYRPLTSCIYLGNIDPWNAFLAVGMIAALESRPSRPRLAGVGWALLTLCKMMPVVLILPLILWRKWRVLEGFAASMLVYFVVLLATGRLGYEWYFVHEAMPVIPVWWRSISIAPLHFAMAMTGHESLYDDPHAYMAMLRVTQPAMAASYAAGVIWVWRRRVSWLRALEPILLLYPFVSPLLEYHHFVWMLPALLLQLKRWGEGRMTPREAAWLLAGWITMQVGYDLSYSLAKWGIWVHFIGLLAALEILAVSLATALREPRGEPEAAPNISAV